jgi:hypothetical protein
LQSVSLHETNSIQQSLSSTKIKTHGFGTI